MFEHELKNAYIWKRPPEVLFNYWDWTNSTWTVRPNETQWTVTKTSTYVSFYNSSAYSQNYLSQYPIDWSKDFLLEMRAYMPSTNRGSHNIVIRSLDGTKSMWFGTDLTNYNIMKCWTEAGNVTWWGNPWTADYFIRKEWTTVTIGRNNTTIYTNNNYTSTAQYYLYEGVYNDTLTIFTAKLTYL